MAEVQLHNGGGRPCEECPANLHLKGLHLAEVELARRHHPQRSTLGEHTYRQQLLGQHFLNLGIGFPVDSLRPAIRSCLAGRSEREVLTRPAVNRRGRSIECSVSVSGLGADQPSGVLILFDTTGADTAGASGKTASPGTAT